ncbi:serine hydrolase domain-containing protein [Natronoglycomyces albus]|uniref:Serine hydrolase n=1 Tax=Natronoglycomyces albus TaxID=2811108 RepID=A0A895XLD5_9ACTN|nr:serine hydrolase domain-containing protein [Natronoglycomyces albus]QSB04363.1 serine hydrolase [Natronoglycomyces albus]
MKRRQILSSAASAAAIPVVLHATGTASHADLSGPTAEEEAKPMAVTPAGPPTVSPDDLEFSPVSLRYGSARQAGLIAEHIDRIVPETSAHLEGPSPSFPGFVVLAARNGVIVTHEAVGHQLRYESWDAQNQEAIELPADQWEQMRPDTIFDLASISKLFTEVVAGQFLDQGLLELDAPLIEYLPEFDSLDAEKSPITIRQLLAHTSGMIAFINLYRLPDNEARMREIYEFPLQFEPGTSYTYSDLNLIVLAKALERISGQGLDVLVREGITEPLGMTDTGYNPSSEVYGRTAATEYQPWIPERGLVRGSVHDENAWSFGGVAGHAGLFSTARDLATFGQMVLNGGEYGGARILSEETTRLIFTNDNADRPPSAARGLGWQINQPFYMDAMTSPVTVGHTGFTGTSLVLDPLSGSMLILLSNRVHPTRERGTASVYRRAAARPMSRAVPVRPTQGSSCWFSGQEDGTTSTLTVPLSQPVSQGSLSFDLWYDTEPTDIGRLLASADGREWTPVPFEATVRDHQWSSDGSFAGFSGRQWASASASLPVGTTQVRFSYESDQLYQGRGIYVDAIVARNRRRPIFMSARRADADSMRLEGWSESGD